MNESAKARYRDLLLAARQEYADQIRMINETGLSMSMTEQYGEFGVVDNHPGDSGSETFEREKDLGLRWHAQERVGEIDRALRALAEGTYGRCAICGREIPAERLKAVPYTLQCVACRQAAEDLPDPNMRPIEESVLEPVFGRSNRDGDPDYNGFDGEDAWQDVAVYGTSETPQDVPEQRGASYGDMYRSDERSGGVEETDLVIDENGDPLL
jgi:YteA family regulatory protein